MYDYVYSVEVRDQNGLWEAVYENVPLDRAARRVEEIVAANKTITIRIVRMINEWRYEEGEKK